MIDVNVRLVEPDTNNSKHLFYQIECVKQLESVTIPTLHSFLSFFNVIMDYLAKLNL